MHIIAGTLKGKNLLAPIGHTTRPTSLRVRQALFDIIRHAPWGGSSLLTQAHTLDVFAGTGALGLEALSRGALFCSFFETSQAAVKTLRQNIMACKLSTQCRVYNQSALTPPKAPFVHQLVFLDPPYSQNLIPLALNALKQKEWLNHESIIVTETALAEQLPLNPESLLAERSHGAACLKIWRFKNLMAE